MKRTSAPVRFNWEMPEMSTIVEIATEFNPTTSDEYSRAATTQYRNPSTDARPALKTSA